MNIYEFTDKNTYTRKNHQKVEDIMSNIKRKSFYISLCVCILAIGAAGFSTYKSIKDFTMSEQRKSSYISSIKKKRTAEEIPKKGVIPNIKEAPGIPKKISAEISKPVNAKGPNESFSTPIEYTKVNKYGNDLKYSDKFKDWRKNDGIDLIGANNSDVYSISDGKVIEVYDDPSYGKTVRVMYKGNDKSDILTSYYDLNDKDINVKKGDSLKKGQKISTLKNNTLHLTMQKNKEMIDPCKVLGIEQ